MTATDRPLLLVLAADIVLFCGRYEHRQARRSLLRAIRWYDRDLPR